MSSRIHIRENMAGLRTLPWTTVAGSVAIHAVFVALIIWVLLHPAHLPPLFVHPAPPRDPIVLSMISPPPVIIPQTPPPVAPPDPAPAPPPLDLTPPPVDLAPPPPLETTPPPSLPPVEAVPVLAAPKPAPPPPPVVVHRQPPPQPVAPPPPPQPIVLAPDQGSRPAPDYPAEFRMRGEQGQVDLQVVFDDQGDIAVAQIVRSTGYTALDRYTADFLRSHWHCPAYANQTVSVPVIYNLER